MEKIESMVVYEKVGNEEILEVKVYIDEVYIRTSEKVVVVKLNLEVAGEK